MYVYLAAVVFTGGVYLLITGIPPFIRLGKPSIFNRISGALFLLGIISGIVFDFIGLQSRAVIFVTALILLIVGMISSANDRIR